MAKRMIDLNSFRTLSGAFMFCAVMALVYKRFTVAGILLTISGAAGVGIFWDRWSRMAGDDVHVTALFNPVRPTTAQFELLATHLPPLLLGIAILTIMAWRHAGEGS